MAVDLAALSGETRPRFDLTGSKFPSRGVAAFCGRGGGGGVGLTAESDRRTSSKRSLGSHAHWLSLVIQSAPCGGTRRSRRVAPSCCKYVHSRPVWKLSLSYFHHLNDLLHFQGECCPFFFLHYTHTPGCLYIHTCFTKLIEKNTFTSKISE